MWVCKTLQLFLLTLLPCSLFSQTLTDTLWSVPWLDGGIDYRPGSGIFTMGTTSAGFYPGDAYDVLLGEEVFTREYLSFNLINLSNPDTSLIVNAIIGIYQFDAIGNDWPNTFPIWNVSGGDTVFCILDHINYGSSLDLGDWTAGDPGDPQTLRTNIGIISNNTTLEYKTMDVTGYVKEDIAVGRMYSQYRMRFPVDTDWDHLGDLLLFKSGNTITNLKPYLIVQYDSTTGINLQPSIPVEFKLFQNYPNPFNPVTTIAYILPKAGKVELTIFDLWGSKVQVLVNASQPGGSYKVQFDGSKLSNGVYWYRLKYERQIITKKMILIR